MSEEDHGKIVDSWWDDYQDSKKMGDYVYFGSRHDRMDKYEDGYVKRTKSPLFPTRAKHRDKNKYSPYYTG